MCSYLLENNTTKADLRVCFFIGNLSIGVDSFFFLAFNKCTYYICAYKIFNMWKRTYSVTTKEVTREQIWKLITDIDHWKDWDNTVEYSRLISEFRVGESFLLKPKSGPKVKIKLIEVTPLKKFTDLTSFPLAKMYGEHLYEETEEGLKITITMSVSGLLSRLWIKLVANDIINHLPENIDNQIKNAKKL